jgi:hypothetical protein
MIARHKHWFIAVLLLSTVHASASAIGDEQMVTFGKSARDFALARDGRPAAIVACTADHPGVLRVIGMFRKDIEQVTGTPPAYVTDGAPPSGPVVIIGTIGKSPVIDALVAAKKLDVQGVAGAWESTVIQTVDHPFPGVPRALVIAGSDKRGTIYGMFRLSEQIGVSPWYWWADVPVQRHRTLSVTVGRHVIASPSVKYRGIFLNDEYPALTKWVQAKFGSAGRDGNPPIPVDVANYGRAFYSRIFELLLRLKANYLWPAMWNNAFNEDDPENPRLADELGIVMGTSHQEPMLRAQKEWDRRFKKTLGYWNYAQYPDTLHRFWRDGIRRNKDYESIITIGLRGADDTPMAPGGVDANRALLQHIVDVQRTIIAEETGRDATTVPQLWCLYKEVLEFYKAGMRAPDDVTLLWPDDNWGNLRRVPTVEERKRKGGAGIYYHFDYHGSPRSYQWVNANPLPKIWDQMSLAKQYGADRIWIVNVGHLKGYELPIEFFMDLGWDTGRWTAGNLQGYTRLWAARQFGSAEAAPIAQMLDDYTRFNGRRKPELLSPSTYSLVNYNEAEAVVAEYNALAARAAAVGKRLPAEYQDAYYELVSFPIAACALVNELYVTAGKNLLYAAQGRASASAMAAATRRLFDADTAMMGHFNRALAGGKWDHFMDQTHLGYTNWADPPENSLRAIPLVEPPIPVRAELGVAVEGADSVWPGTMTLAALPAFDRATGRTGWIDVFNKGSVPFAFTATSGNTWIRVIPSSGTVSDQARLLVSVDWRKVPPGENTGTIRINGAGADVNVTVSVLSQMQVRQGGTRAFLESDGHVAIEAEHFSGSTAIGTTGWAVVPGYGHTLSGMRASGMADQPAFEPGKGAPCLTYDVVLRKGGDVKVTGIFGSTLNFLRDRDLRYAIAFDDQAPRIVTLVPKTFIAQHGDMVWEAFVADNAHHSTSEHVLGAGGKHILRIWMVDPGVVLQKVVIDCGGVRPSYLGPPESTRAPGR